MTLRVRAFNAALMALARFSSGIDFAADQPRGIAPDGRNGARFFKICRVDRERFSV